MKYFTPELYARLQLPSEEEMDAADAAWDEALERYEQQLARFRPQLPEHIRFFLDDLLLHDAIVWSVARREDKFIMVLHKDIPPRDLVILTYTLTAEPVIDREALPEEHRSNVMDFMYDEIDLVQEGDQKHYTESILFGNGWEVRLEFSDVQVELAQPIYPVTGTMLVPVATGAVPQSA